MKNLNNTIFASLVLTEAILSSCTGTSEKKTVEQVSTTVTEPNDATLKGCYIAILKKDTMQLAITSVNGTDVEGSLVYNFAEKDRSKGTFKGKYNAGILLANYTFNAEGTSSERQVIFKRIEGGMAEGHGEAETKDKKEVFKDLKTVTFDETNSFKRTENCLP